jgi:tetratricopeptide (TPR) repeat protein
MRELAVFLFAFALRLLHLLQIRDTAIFQNPVVDGRFYYLWAQEIARGDWVGHQVFVLNPGYAYFLAAVFKAHAVGTLAPVLIQAALGAAACVMVYRLGAALCDARAALVAAALAALYPVSIVYDGLLATAAIIDFLNLSALALLIAAKKHWQLLLSGAAIGLSALFRPTVLAFVPFVLIWLALRGRRQDLLLFAAGCALIVAPVLARNAWVGGRLAIASAGVGLNLFIGNNPQAVGTYAPQPFESGDPGLQALEYRQEASRRSGRILTDAEAATFWFSETVRFVVREPVRFGGLLLKKAALFVNKAEIPTNMSPDYLASLSYLRHLPLLTFGTLLPLALLGMVFVKGAEAALLKGYVAAYLLANLIFFVGSEYRYPAVSALFVFCGAALVQFVQQARSRSFRALLLPGLALAALLVGCNLDLYHDDLSVLHNNLGNINIRLGRYDDAVAEYRAALEIAPANVPARANLAAAYFNRKDYVGAIAEYRRVLEFNRDFADAYYHLGLAYYYRGDRGAALPLFEKALALKPDWPEARSYRDLAKTAAP